MNGVLSPREESYIRVDTTEVISGRADAVEEFLSGNPLTPDPGPDD